MSAGLVPSRGHMGMVCPGLSPWSVDGHLLPVSSHNLPPGHVCVQIPSFYKDTSQMDQVYSNDLVLL